MECLYYVEGGLKNDIICSASLSRMTPSILERIAYCETEDNYRCPILLAYTLRKGYRAEVVREAVLCSR